MKWKETKKMKRDSKLANERNKYSVYCKFCGWRNHIFPVMKEQRVICKNCGRWIYKNDKVKFEIKLKEVMKKCKSSN